MLSNMEFIRMSLETHLFFARIMKEHSFFLELGFTPRDHSFMQQADDFRKEFDMFLGDVIRLSNGIVSPSVLNSGEVITPYTLNAEMAASYYTGIDIPVELTQAEEGLASEEFTNIEPIYEQRVFIMNQRAMTLIESLISFKTTILSHVLTCKMFTVNYPLLIDHITREAKLYLQIIQRIQSRQSINIEREIVEQEAFWNQIMAEHSKFIRGLLDPTEEELIVTANNFGNQFDKLTEEAKAAMDSTVSLEQVTEDSLQATKAIQEFKTQGTQGLLECKIKSIIIPLLGDHTLREANHYLRLLQLFES